MFLEMSRIDGIDLSEVGKECRKPAGVRHNYGGECDKCMNIAKANAEHFIQTVLLPELAKLRSDTRGLDGFVLPPAWMLEYDTRSHWDVKTSSYEEFVFTHGDLGPDNLRMDPNTLTVKCVIDWEHSRNGRSMLALIMLCMRIIKQFVSSPEVSNPDYVPRRE